MKTLLLLLLATLQAPPSPSGVWNGAINLPGQDLAVSVTLSHSNDGWTGTIDIPAQGAKGLPLGGIEVSSASVSFSIQAIPGQPVFSGTLAADGKTMSGTFAQGGSSFPFKLGWKSEAKAVAPSEIVDGGKLEGVWEGTVPVGGQSIRLVLKVTKTASGSITATFSSPDQGSPELPVTGLAFKNSALHLEIPAVQGSYDGTMGADGLTITGTFTQGSSMPLALRKTGTLARR